METKTVAVITSELREQTAGFWWTPDTTPSAAMALFEAELKCWHDCPGTRVRLVMLDIDAELTGDDITEHLDGFMFDAIYETAPAILDEVIA